MIKEIEIGSENLYKIWIMWFYVSWVEYIQSCTFITNLLALKGIMAILCTFIHQFWKALKTKPIITLALITTQANLKKTETFSHSNCKHEGAGCSMWPSWRQHFSMISIWERITTPILWLLEIKFIIIFFLFF